MKALLLSAIVFFSLRAMSAEVGEDQKGQCIYADQTAKREAKVVVAPDAEDKKEDSSSVSK